MAKTEKTATVPESQPLNIQVDRSKITLGDMLFMTSMKSKSERGEDGGSDTVERMLNMLNRIVVGGIEDIPFDALEDVMAAVSASLNPEEKLKN